MAYISNDSGKYEVLVQRFVEPSSGSSPGPLITAVSNGGGTAPRWGRDGRELYFLTLDGWVMMVDVHATTKLTVSPARRLFRLPGPPGDWDVVSDGSRFLVALPSGAEASSPFSIIQNQLAQLRAAAR